MSDMLELSDAEVSVLTEKGILTGPTRNGNRQVSKTLLSKSHSFLAKLLVEVFENRSSR